MGKWLAVAAIVAAVTGCNLAHHEVPCTTDDQCRSAAIPDGRCEPGLGVCTAPDAACPGGRRVSDPTGGPGKCVGEEPPPIDASIDAPPDVPIDAPRTCFGGSFFNVCLQSAPSQPLMVAAASTLTVDTDPAASQSMCVAIDVGRSTPGSYCVVAATTMSIDGTVRGFGPRPLVLVSADAIAIGGTIDVGSHRGGVTAGAGSNPASCALVGTVPGLSGGGAGGTFGGQGGNGGGGQNQATGGIAAAPAALTELRGGCSGQLGLGTSLGATKSIAGRGGGAVYLIAAGTISIAGSGRINAAGEGAGGGTSQRSGGGGGGAGGLIGLDGQTITSSGLLLASGGSGGEGSDNSTGGDPGADPTSTNPAAGGAHGGNGAGGNGGDGSSRAASGGANGSPNIDGGGGGGGGAGVIKAPASATLGMQVAPPSTP